MTDHDDAEQRDEAEHRLVGGERCEAGEPSVERTGEDEGHQPEVNEVDRHIDQGAGERDVVVAAGFGPLLGGLLVGGVCENRRAS